MKEYLKDQLIKHQRNVTFDIVSNPEFLREGSAVKDCMNPDRIIIGCEGVRAAEVMKNIYHLPMMMGVPVIFTNNQTAELIKYASNTFLATKVSFINEIATICELCGADVTLVSKAMGLDKRIGDQFLKAGPGYGGSCFPKDTKAFIGIGKSLGYVPKIVNSTHQVNSVQKKRIIRKIKKAVGNPRGKIITILGIAFKADTDDVRDSPAIPIIKALVHHGAKVQVYDPKAMENGKLILNNPNIEFCENIASACKESHCVVIVTDWKDFLEFDWRIAVDQMKTLLFIDLRNVFDPVNIEILGFNYLGIGRGPV